MEDLESKLRGLRLRRPSQNLDERIMAQKPERPVQPSPARWRVPVWLAAAAALVMAVAGFAAGRAWRGNQTVAMSRSQPSVMLQVIYHSPSSANPFDFTRASDIFPAGKMETTIQTSKGI